MSKKYLVVFLLIMKSYIISSVILLLIVWCNVASAQINNNVSKAEEAERIRQIGHTYFNAKKYDSALFNYNIALEKFRVLSDSLSIAKCYNNIANSQLFLGNNEEAIFAYYAAIKINKLLNNSKVLTGNYINLASYYYRQKEFNLALQYYLEAKDEVAKTGDAPRLGLIYSGLGSILSEKTFEGHNYTLANTYYHNALSKYVESQDSSKISAVYNNLGVLLSDEYKYDSALFYYSKSIAIKSVLGDKRGQIMTLLNMGNIYMEQGNYGIALNYYTKGSELAIQFEDNVNYLHFLTNILKCKIKLGKSKEADSLFAIYNSLNDSIYDQEKAKNLKKLEVLYETQKIGNDLKDQIKQTKAKTRLSYWYLTLAIGIAILFILTVLIFIQRQRFQQRIKAQELDRLKHEQEIIGLNAIMQGQEDERNRIAEDIHDRLGAGLAAIKLFSEYMEHSNPQLTKMLDKAITDTREISHNLSTEMITRFGLAHAINDLVQDINQSNAVVGTFIATDIDKRFKKNIEKAIYYVILELLNNLIKHASASLFSIQLTYFEGIIDLIYEDDGQGFVVEESKLNGMGMQNLKARIESIKGFFSIASEPNKGVQVVISVPISTDDITSD